MVTKIKEKNQKMKPISKIINPNKQSKSLIAVAKNKDKRPTKKNENLIAPAINSTAANLTR